MRRGVLAYVLLVSMFVPCLDALGQTPFRIDSITTSGLGGPPRDEFSPGERILCTVRFTIRATLPGTVSVNLRVFGQGCNLTTVESVPGGSGERVVVFGNDPALRIPTSAGEGKITLSVQIDSEGAAAQAEGRAHAYVSSTCAASGFPRRYLGYAPVSMQPYDMAFSRDDRYVYVTSNEQRNITVVDTERLEASRVIEDLDTIGLPRGITANRDGSEMLVSDYAMGKIHVIDTASQQWREGIAVTNRKGLLGNAFNRPRNELYVTDFSHASLIVCNGSSYALEHEIPLVDPDRGLYGLNPLDLRVDPTGSWAYVYCQFFGQVVKIDLARRRVAAWNADVDAESWGVDLSPDGTLVYVVYPDIVRSVSRIYAIATADMSLSRLYEVGATLWDLVVGPDGRYGYAVDSYRGEVMVIDLAAGELLEGCSVPIGYGGKIIRPNNGWTKLFVGSWTQPYLYVVAW